eukprot:7377361-Prymnesium_polylepis.2
MLCDVFAAGGAEHCLTPGTRGGVECEEARPVAVRASAEVGTCASWAAMLRGFRVLTSKTAVSSHNVKSTQVS